VLTAGLVLLLAGHLAALLLPRAILAWNRAPLRLYLLEGAAFGLGLLTLGAWLRATRRHLRRGSAALVVEIGDALFLAMMFLAIASGLGMAALDRWSSSWGIVTLRPYLLSLLAGDPQRALVDGLPFLTRLHLFATFAAVAVFPLTRLAPLPILLVARGAAVCARPLGRASRSCGVALWNWCAVVLWNEPHYRWRDKSAAAAEAALAAARASWGGPALHPHLANGLAGERTGSSSATGESIRKARR
jgi:hypothetical protein